VQVLVSAPLGVAPKPFSRLRPQFWGQVRKTPQGARDRVELKTLRMPLGLVRRQRSSKGYPAKARRSVTQSHCPFHSAIQMLPVRSPMLNTILLPAMLSQFSVALASESRAL